MYIEKIILNGFKSYREHTVVDGFDPLFNAITGLNGSGKSNIFDAICFVLGMSSTVTLRSEGNSITGLIYKAGQAGISKASVEIIFNNTNKDASPIGYREFDHIKVARHVNAGSIVKYFINDHPANRERVQNLFHSVQLNVNNPHFLVQQNRIQKILNMKPPEILKLIEEAAGISMYQTKKDDSVRVLNKKQHQLDEIARIITENLEPNLEKLRTEKENYNRWFSSKGRLDHLIRWLLAEKYVRRTRIIEEAGTTIEEARKHLEEIKENETKIKSELKEILAEIQRLIEFRENDTKKTIAQAQERKEKAQEDFDTAERESKQTDDEEKRILAKIKRLQKEAEKQGSALKELEKERERAEKLKNDAIKRAKEASDLVAQLEKRITDVNIGIANENDSTSISDQIETERRAIANFDVQISRIQNSQPHLIRQRDSMRSQLESTKAERDRLLNKKEQFESQLRSVEDEMRSLNFDPEEERRLLQERDALTNSINRLRDELEGLERQLGGARLRFDVQRARARGVDLDSVYGTVAELCSMRDERRKYATAAQITAGGSLFNVVTEDKETSASLIKSGALYRRTTTIPLQEIAHSRVDGRTLSKAQSIDGTAHAVIDDIKFDPKFTPAFEYVFGNMICCDTDAGAQEVTFSPNGPRRKAVTMEGNVFDPHGTLTGGSKPKFSDILRVMTQYKDSRRRYDDDRSKLEQVNRRLSEISSAAGRFRELDRHRQMAQQQLDMCQRSLDNTRFNDISSQIESVEAELAKNAEDSESFARQRGESQQRLVQLEAELAAWNREKSSRLDSLRAELSKARRESESAAAKANKYEIEFEGINVSMKEAQSTVDGGEKEIAELEKAAEAKHSALERAREQMESARKELEEAQKILNDQHSVAADVDKQLKKQRKAEDSKTKELKEAQSQYKKTNASIQNTIDKKESYKKKLSEMLSANPWIDTEKAHFGKPHSDIKFNEFPSRKAAKDEFNALNRDLKELESTVNKRVMAMYERAETELRVLNEKRDVVENEKKKIIEVIEELDQKKDEALLLTRKEVNKSLKEIVSSLIIGAKAKIVDMTDDRGNRGFELVVKFNDVTKGLHELSGGQRSMLALGLILALLKFHPAPIYILDEIDAALDLSHTQDIGHMLRDQFNGAQFIVVSLKEDLYKYANVLFRTSFDGTSHVTRIEQKKNV